MRPGFLDFKKLTYFVEVARELHFGRAARRLGVSQPPLTEHIKDLEHRLGLKLFDRTRRNVTLTVAGKILLAEAERLLRQADQVQHVMQGVREGSKGYLSLGCVPTALHEFLPAILSQFRTKHPGIQVVLREAHSLSIIEAVTNQELDVGFVWGDDFKDPISSRIIAGGSFLAALPRDHPLASKAHLSLADIAPEPLVLTPRTVSSYHFDKIIASFGKVNLEPRIEYEIPTVLSQLGFVASGLAIALLAPFTERLANDDVVFRKITPHSVPFAISVIWNVKTDSLSTNAFRQVISDQFPRLQEIYIEPRTSEADASVIDTARNKRRRRARLAGGDR
jgi:DNA-binding transcriptional LysR family regulator